MSHSLLNPILRIALASATLAATAYGQAPCAQPVASATTVSPNALNVPSTIEPGPSRDTSDPAIDPASLLPDLPWLPTRKASLIGGTIEKLDRVRDQFTVQIFGGGRMKIYFDPRTHIYRDAKEVSASDLRPGDRVYIDTILNGSTIFARNIRLKTAGGGDGQGTVINYRSDKGELIVRDTLSPEPLKLHLTSQTRLIDSGRAAAASELVPGTLVAVKFGAEKDGRVAAREVSILAIPGASFTFAGRVTGLDLSSGLLTLISATDDKTYDIYLDSSTVAVTDGLRQAADVTVRTLFDGHRYVARSVTVN